MPAWQDPRVWLSESNELNLYNQAFGDTYQPHEKELCIQNGMPSNVKMKYYLQGHFPEAEKDPVIQIASMVTVQGEERPCVRNVMTLNTCAPIVGAEVMSFQKEEDLLRVSAAQFSNLPPSNEISLSSFLKHSENFYLESLSMDFWDQSQIF